MRKTQSAMGSTRSKSGQGNNMVCRRNHPFFNNNLPPPRQFLCNKILLKKLASVRGMPIEQIFELRGPGPFGPICTPITGCFHDKTIISEKNIPLDCYSLLQCCWRQCTLLLPPTWVKSLTKFNPKIKDFKRVLDLHCKQKKD